jgi:hypothetical protein
MPRLADTASGDGIGIGALAAGAAAVAGPLASVEPFGWVDGASPML